MSKTQRNTNTAIARVVERLSDVARGARPVEPIALALALGLELSPQLSPGARVVGDKLEFDATESIAEIQALVIHVVAAWQLAHEGVVANDDAVAAVCSALGKAA